VTPAGILESGALVVAAVVAGMFAWAFWSRRGERRGDPPGVRTLASFRGAGHHVLASERQAQREKGEPLGQGALQALAEELRRLGITVARLDLHESFAWSAHIERGSAKAYLILGERPGDGDEWLLLVQDSSSGGPGPRSLLGDIHAALTRVAELRDITWHSRQCFDGGDEVSSAASSPVDE
jgi:hypothetical protein